MPRNTTIPTSFEGPIIRYLMGMLDENQEKQNQGRRNSRENFGNGV